MKYLIIILAFIISMGGLSSCTFREGPTRIHYHSEITHRTRTHFGAPRKQSYHDRYWGRHKYGPRPNWYRGAYK